MGRTTRWFQSAVQVFRACVGRRSARIDVQKEKTTKKKRGYRLWVFRRRKDRSSSQAASSSSSSSSSAAAAPSACDAHEAAVDTPLKSVLKRLDADVEAPGCSQAKEVTFGEMVQVKVYKVKAAARFLRDAQSEHLLYERTDIDVVLH